MKLENKGGLDGIVRYNSLQDYKYKNTKVKALSL